MARNAHCQLATLHVKIKWWAYTFHPSAHIQQKFKGYLKCLVFKNWYLATDDNIWCCSFNFMNYMIFHYLMFWYFVLFEGKLNIHYLVWNVMDWETLRLCSIIFSVVDGFSSLSLHALMDQRDFLFFSFKSKEKRWYRYVRCLILCY